GPERHGAPYACGRHPASPRHAAPPSRVPNPELRSSSRLTISAALGDDSVAGRVPARGRVDRARFARLRAIVVSPHGDRTAQTAHGIYRCIPDTATWRKPGQATSLAALPGRDS